MIPKAIPLRDESLFRLAMCHRSAAIQNPVADSYERIEFFGDSILGLIIAQFLYEQHPTWDQGMLSKAKSTVVQEGPLAATALRLGFDKFMVLSSGEEQLGGRTRPSILADIFEAVVGAIYIESGLEVTRWFVLEQLREYLDRISQGDVNPDDFKSKLQEVAQSVWRTTPQYRVIGEYGQAHEKLFMVQVLIGSVVMGEGKGKSKKEAEQSAANDALTIIENNRQKKLDPTPLDDLY